MKNEIIYLAAHFPFLKENGNNPSLKLLIPEEIPNYMPKRPCMLLCPGGGYEFCSPREEEPIALHFATQGFNVFSLTYSTAPNTFPTQLREVAAALELIYENAEKWLCDKEKIVICGFSAGGHLAAHYANAYACEEVREVFPDSKPVNACILGYPVISGFVDTHWGTFRCLSGHDPYTEEDAQRFSCEKMVSPQTPPTFIWHTWEDTSVPPINTVCYAQALYANRVLTELHIYPRGPHGGSTFDRVSCAPYAPQISRNQDWLHQAKLFLQDVFQLP